MKDETGNVSGSHKARHLFGVLVYLEVAERLGRATASGPTWRSRAAATPRWRRRSSRPRAGARSASSSRSTPTRPWCTGSRSWARSSPSARATPGVRATPPVARLVAALAEGALPFTCQGNLNGLAVEGGETLGYEIASARRADRPAGRAGRRRRARERLQPGLPRGARARRAATRAPPRHGADRGRLAAASGRSTPCSRTPARASLGYAARHRSEFMWPWEQEPHSIAHGILDDETYDWLAVVEAMLATGGTAARRGREHARAGQRARP